MNSKGSGELIIISIMLLWQKQGLRSGESTRLSAPTWPGFVSVSFSQGTAVFSSYQKTKNLIFFVVGQFDL